MAMGMSQQLTPILNQFAFASLTTLGRERPTLILRIGHHQAVSAAMQQWLDELFGLVLDGVMRYRDRQGAVEKKALIANDRLLALKLAGETKAMYWLRDLMVEDRPVGDLRRRLFAPLDHLPAGSAGRGRIVCNCLDVSIFEIETVLAEGADLERLQQRLSCGTSCGSCLPELRACVARSQAAHKSLLAA
jgi:assimilatory nitrate reductase catalytic subunit